MKCEFCKKELTPENESEHKGVCKDCLANGNKRAATGVLIFIAIIVVIILCLNSAFDSLFSTSSSSDSDEPSKIELMSYAQTVLEKELDNPSYSRNTSDYTFVNTNLRYKIEGEVTVNGTTEDFYMIIAFTDDTYEKYDLISLQVGNQKY